MSTPKKFYITTTLPYVNSAPHIGFALEIIQADAIARYKKLCGYEVIFNTGTDEHGLKIFRKAEELGQDPKTYCDEYAEKFRVLKSALNLSFTHFIRTTDDYHLSASQEFWKRCMKNGDIYKKAYKVKYCVGCELEKTDSELADGRCPVHPNLDIEHVEEENYFFRFSKFQKPLLDLYKKNPDFVLPPHRLLEISNFVESGLEDFSISRLKAKMPWGVPVPDDDEHVMYVWFDALINYISTLGWPNDEDSYSAWWPGTQIAGKDNLRQQSSMWQSMLLSAGLPPSRQILIHGFITSEGQKMSKSLNNVVDPIEMVEKYGIDALRYYLLREIPTYEDGDFSQARFDALYQSDLADTLGNLVNRVITMVHKYFGGNIPQTDFDPPLKNLYKSTIDSYVKNIESFQIKEAVEQVLTILRDMNSHIDSTKPWQLAKEKKETELANSLVYVLECVRIAAILLWPVIPGTSEKIAAMLRFPIVELPTGEQYFKAGMRVLSPEILFAKKDV
ncbi:MAG: methionine--tRNA ligase [Patescibacteria group bacterium]